MTRGYSGADIREFCSRAGLIALTRDSETDAVHMCDFEQALYVVTSSLTPSMMETLITWQRTHGSRLATTL